MTPPTTTTVLSVMDNTATAFQAHLPDDKEVPTRILPNNFPTLNSPAQNSWEAWNTRDRSYAVNTVNGLDSSFYPSLRSFIQVDGARALIWCMDARDEAPSQFTFDSDITAYGLITYNEYSNVLVFCTGRKVELHIACRYPGAPSPHYVQAGLIECTCPDEVTAFAASGDGRALLGTRTGAIYQLTIQAEGQTLLDGIRHRLDRLHWEWKRYLGRVAPVRVIHVDPLRNLAFVLHNNSEINVFSLEPGGVFGGKPIRIANLERGQNGPILTSIHALPRFGFRDCVLVGSSPTGECFFYYLEPSISGKWKLETRNLTKKAKTYCGFGLDKNLVMKYQNKMVPPKEGYFREVLGEGYWISVANVLDTTIILNGYNPGTDQTALFELKLAINGHYDLSLIQSLEGQGGRIEGVVKWEEPNDHFRGAQRLPEHQLLWEDELNRQMFYGETKFLIFTKTHHRRMKKESHCEMLIKILNLDSDELLDQFLESYSPQETAAMLLYLRVCNYDVLKAFGASSKIMEHAVEGMHLFLKRILAPVWLNPVFGLEPADFIFLRKDSVFVKMNKEEFQFYKGYLERLKDVLSEFMTFIGIRIYRNGSIYCPISGPLSLEEAKGLKDLREFVEKLNSVILFIEKLSESKTFSIKECTKKETLLSVLDMSLRDFVSFAIYDRGEYLDFLKEIRLQLGDYDWRFMNHFILKEAPFLLQKPEEIDAQTPEEEEEVLPLGERISMMNERLHQVKETEPCSATRKRKIRDHYNDVFVECTDLMNAYDYEGLSREFLERCKEFIINVKTIEDQMVQDVIWKVILGANFAQPEILKLDPLFEELLTSQLKQVLEKRRLPLILDQHQLQAIDTMIQLLKAEGRELETAELHVTLALREKHPSVQIMGLAERIAHLKVALRSFNSLRRRSDSNLTQGLINNLVRQKEILKLVRTRYAGVEMEDEDKEFLDELECRQSSLTLLRDLVKVCLEDDDEQTAKAFESSRFKNASELIEELEIEH